MSPFSMRRRISDRSANSWIDSRPYALTIVNNWQTVVWLGSCVCRCIVNRPAVSVFLFGMQKCPHNWHTVVKTVSSAVRRAAAETRRQDNNFEELRHCAVLAPNFVVVVQYSFFRSYHILLLFRPVSARFYFFLSFSSLVNVLLTIFVFCLAGLTAAN